MDLSDIHVKVVDAVKQPDGSHNYTLNIKGLNETIAKTGDDTVQALKDGHISPQEAGQLVTDVAPFLGEKILGYLALARLGGLKF